MKTANRFNSVITGLVPGILIPVITMITIWAVRFGGNLGEFIVDFQRMGALSKLVSLSVIPNLLLFFIFTWLNQPQSSKGVIFATFIMAFVMLILKFS